jgi:DNA polymerase-3 subunit alpha
MIEKLIQYCKNALISVSVEGNVATIDGLKYGLLDDDSPIFNEDMEFGFDSGDLDGFIFEFGGRWYIQPSNTSHISFNELKYVGEANTRGKNNSFLGVRSGYELMNGMGTYDEWIKKAKFFGVSSLGICERNTLSGALEFQSKCKSNGLKSIIGLTIPTKGKFETFDIKLYCKNFQGWQNLLKFNTKINVDQEPYVELDFIQDNLEGLFVVVDPKSMKFEDCPSFCDFYQLDTPYYLDSEVDVLFMRNFEKFLKSGLEPISITDAFYLERDDYLTREAMWKVDKSFDDKTNNQYFKSKEEHARELSSMFEKDCTVWKTLFVKAMKNEDYLAENCNFQYDTDTRHLPKYIMTKEESDLFDTNEQLFMHLVREGFKSKSFPKDKRDFYIERVKSEIEVLKMGDVIDYFLGLYDIIRDSREKGLLTGIGRGSAGGSLIAYLLGIIQIDPIEFDLLFERFLNSGRMGEWEDRPSYDVEMDNGEIVTFAEGSLIRVLRDEKEKVIFIQDLIEGDEVLRY